mgnify:CR=1 FL=1
MVIVGILGIVILLSATVSLSIITYKMIRKNKSKILIGLNIFLILVFVLYSCLTSLSLSYNYFYLKGSNLFFQNKHQEAIKPLKRALMIRKKIGILSKLMEIKILGVPLFYSSEKDVRILSANAYKSSGNYKEAIKEFGEVISLDNNNFDAIAGIAESLFLLRNFKEAKQYYQKLIEIQPKENNFNYYFQTGRAFMVLLDYDNAIKYFKKALEFDKENEIVSRYIEICYESKNR